MLPIIGVKGDEKIISVFMDKLAEYMASETKDICASIHEDENFIMISTDEWRFSLKKKDGHNSNQLLKASSHMIPHITVALFDIRNSMEEHNATIVISSTTEQCSFVDHEGIVLGNFDLDRIEICHQLLLSIQSKGGILKDFNLHVNNKVIGCNEFVRDVFKRGIVGMISSLKNVEHPGRVNLRFFLDEKE